jgi:hypothetical protein
MPFNSTKSTHCSDAEIPIGRVLRPLTLARVGVALFCAAALGELLGLWHVHAGIAGLPDLCLFHRLTGWTCPGCGMGRALALLAGGAVPEAWRQHPFAVPFLAWMLSWAILGERQRRWVLDRLGAGREILPAAACVVLIVWWLAMRIA